MKELVFLNWADHSLPDKTQPYTPRLDVIEDVALQISTTLQDHPNLRLILGHGSGSFGHVAASEYQTRDRISPPVAADPSGAGPDRRKLLEGICRGLVPGFSIKSIRHEGPA